MKKINVSEERCIGCGACVAIDPEHFEFNDEGKSTPITNENLESENLVNAIESCPTSAIEMVEEAENNCNCPNGSEEECTCENCECEEDGTCDNPDCNCNPCTCENCECHDTLD